MIGHIKILRLNGNVLLKCSKFMIKSKLENTVVSLLSIFIVLIGLCLTSCSHDENINSECELTTSIILNIPLIENESRVPVNGDESSIEKLRVIILSEGAKSINRTFNKSDLASSIIIENVPVGKVEMYVIANEASLGRNYDDLINLKNEVIQVGTKRKVLITDDGRINFPKRGSEFPGTGLPMSWMNKELQILPPSEIRQEVNVELKRCVAKLNINMKNNLSTPISITSISFGSFFGDKLYLFQEEKLDVPNDNVYADRTFDHLNIPIETGQTENLVCYIYPSFAWYEPIKSSPYTIGFTIDGGLTYYPQAFVKDYETLNSIERNTQVNIDANLNPINMTINFIVKDWTTETINVPDFE